MNKEILETLAKSFNVTEAHAQWTDADDKAAIRLKEVVGNEKSEPIDCAVVMLSNIEKHGVIPQMELRDYGSIYLTAKRLIYKHLKQ